MNLLALLLLMFGALLIWAGITDNSVIDLLGSVFNRQAKKGKNA